MLMNGRRGREGFTLIELLIVIVLIFIAGAAITANHFPTEAELETRTADQALLLISKSGRIIANQQAKPVQVRFYDQTSEFAKNDMDFAKKFTVNLNAITNLKKFKDNFQKNGNKYLCKTPLFIITEDKAKGKVIADDKGEIAYISLPENKDSTGYPAPSRAEFVNLKDIDSPTARPSAVGTPKESMTIFPSGISDGWTFAINAQYYRVDPISGEIIDLSLKRPIRTTK